MRLRKLFLPVFVITFLLFTYAMTGFSGNGDEQIVLIKTEFGVMKAKLYNETPLHRDNFIKLANEGFYNDLLFHRIIKEFMIQGGDPDSRGAEAGKRLGTGGPDYQITAEINKSFFHKKGALCAARQGDNVNPEKKSSGSQFYIVQGKVWTPDMLKQFEESQKFQTMRNEAMKIYSTRTAEVQRLQSEGKMDSIKAIQVSIQQYVEQNIDSTMFKINQERRDAYTTIGGTPHLDGGYTVFGEIIEGLDIVDSIAKQQTAPGDRPLRDIKMTIEVVK